jgi:melanoma-associated antigen
LAAQTEEAILEAEAALVPSDDEDDESESGPSYYGSIISWSTADQLGPTGVLYIILALILVSGRVMSDGELHKCIHDLNGPLRYCS